MSIPPPLGHSAHVRLVSERMPFLSSNKDSCRTHQSSERLHQICAVSSSSDSGRFLTLRNISLAQVPDQRNPSLDLSHSFDEKCDNAFPSPMNNAIYSSRDFQDALAIAPIEIMPLTNMENVTPVKYPSLDLSDLSFSSLNESLEGSENFPGASNLETPNARRVSFPNRRREYVLSKRPLGALGTGVITSSMASSKTRQSKNRSSFVEEGRSNRDILNTSLQLKKALENQSDRRKTIHSWQVTSPPKKVQRSESTPDSYAAREPWKAPSIESRPSTSLPEPGRRDSRPHSLDLQVCSKSGGLPRSDRQTTLQGFKFQSTQAATGHPVFEVEETVEKPTTGLRARLIFSPSKNGLPLVRVKRSAPIILSRKGKTKNSLLRELSQNSTHFTPSKFLNNPQSSTPVSKRLRDRRNSLLDDMQATSLATPSKFNPSCKKQIFPDLDDPVLAPPLLRPVPSLESSANELQVDFGRTVLPLASEGHKDPLITPSKELTGSYHDDQMFSPMGLFVDSPTGRDIREMANNSTDSLESAIDFPLASSVASLDAFLDMAADCFDFEDEDKIMAPVVIQPRAVGESRPVERSLVGGEASLGEGLGNVRIVDNESGNYFTCNNEDVEILISYNGGGQIFNVVENVVPEEFKNFEQRQPQCDDDNVSAMNVTDIMENDLPDTFMKVVCCETTHRKSLVQQAREVLGVSEPPKS